MRSIYGVFWLSGYDSKPRWGMTSSKREALKVGKRNKGLVGSVSRDAFRGGDQYGIDAPTFRALMDLVADYRTPET